MPDLFDFGFDDPAPSEVKAPAAKAKAPPPAQADASVPCERRAFAAGYACRVGKGDASFSDNLGRSWFCRTHAPRDFFEHQRKEALRG